MRHIAWHVAFRSARVLSVLSLFALLFNPQPLPAQEVTAGINGVVTDPTGAAIAGAKVTAKDLDRGTTSPTVTGGDGAYSLPRVPIGRYEVRVEAPGFQTAVHSDITLVLNQVAQVNFQMQVGNVNQTVEVTTAPPLLQTESTEVGTVIDAHAVVSLPLETRNYNQLTLLTPGAVTTSPSSFNTGQATFNSGRPYINGNREQATYYLLDGMENIEFVNNDVAFSPNVDAIQEFNLITSNPSAEFGQFMGGVISVSTKSGSNQFHGNLFEFIRNDKLNANEWSNNFTLQSNGQPTPKPLLRWNEFGGTLGGPIVKDKLFFFVDYQGSRYDTPASPTTITTFSQLEQSQPGNFSDIPGIALHYPGTKTPIPGNNLNNANKCASAQQMSLNSTAAVPCVYISPVALKLFSAFPTATLGGTNGGTLNNAINTQHTYTNGDQGDAKVDWSPTDKDRVFGRYSQQYVAQPTINSQALLYSSNGNSIFPLYQGVLGYTRTFSPTLVNEIRAGVNYFPAEANVQSVGAANSGNLVPGEPTSFLPGFFFSGAPIGGGSGSPAYGTVDAPEVFHQTSIQFDDTVIISKGTNTIRTGFQFNRYRNDYIPAITNDGVAGQIGFSGGYTGNAETDFLLGLPASIGLSQGTTGTVGQRNSAIGAFVQDDWRVTPKLTVNLGLRWQLFTPLTEVDNRMTNFQEGTGAIELAGQNGNSRALYNQYNGIANFLPRVGIAWSLNSNTVVRAAFSRSSFQEGTGEYNRLATNAPWNNDLSYTSTPGANGAVPANQIFLDQGFTSLASAQTGVPCTVATVTSAPASCFAGTRIHLQDPNYRPAISNQWNFTIQHQFGRSLTAQAGYVGQHNDHLADIVNAGQSVIVSTNPLTLQPTPYFAGNPAILADKPGQIRLNETTGKANYDALQLSVQQRVSNGLEFLMNYTWSKCLTNNQGYYARYGDAGPSQASNDVSFQEYAYNINLDYGFCDHDVTNVFNGYLTYNLPFGKNRQFGSNANKIVNAILGDWQASTVFTVHGGFPISMLYYGFDPTGAYFQPRPDCNSPSRQTPYKEYGGGGYIWFDPSTMSAPPPNRFGTCGISTERGPGLKQVDIGLSKFFPITERMNVEFRAEAINAFNTPIFVLNAYSVDIFGGSGEGVVNTSRGARNFQFGLKLGF